MKTEQTTRKGGNVVQYVPKERYFDNRAEKSLLAKAKEAIAREEAATKNSGASMFQKPFWKNNPDLNEDKVSRSSVAFFGRCCYCFCWWCCRCSYEHVWFFFFSLLRRS